MQIKLITLSILSAFSLAVSAQPATADKTTDADKPNVVVPPRPMMQTRASDTPQNTQAQPIRTPDGRPPMMPYRLEPTQTSPEATAETAPAPKNETPAKK